MMKKLNFLAIFLAFCIAENSQAIEGMEGTTITSDSMEMQSEGDKNTFKFVGNVELKTEGMDAKADNLEVISRKTASASQNFGDVDGIEIITATGNVIITEEKGRRITAGKAEIFPAEGTMIFTENPRVEDEQGIVEGPKIVIEKETRVARVVAEKGVRPTITLTQLKGLKSGNKLLK